MWTTASATDSSRKKKFASLGRTRHQPSTRTHIHIHTRKHTLTRTHILTLTQTHTLIHSDSQTHTSNRTLAHTRAHPHAAQCTAFHIFHCLHTHTKHSTSDADIYTPAIARAHSVLAMVFSIPPSMWQKHQLRDSMRDEQKAAPLQVKDPYGPL